MEWSTVTDWLGSHGVRILIIVLISVACYFALRRFLPRIVALHVSKAMADKPDTAIEKRRTTLSRVLMTTAIAFIAIAALFMILSEAGINITPVIAGVGIVGVALGFGAQYLVRDLIAGFFILIENQYGVGDVVKIADISGIVEDVNLRRTILRDLDGIVHSVPNGEIRVASNFTKEWSRVNLNISVAYGEDLDRVTAVLNKIGQEMAEEPYWKEALLTAPQVLRVDAFEDSGIAIKILGETKPIRQWEVMGELRRRIKRIFDEEGIEIPWPHTKVYFGGPPTPKAPTEAPAPPTPPRPPSEVLPPDDEEGD
jgi:small-conductance mechanosensitive channel